MAARKRKQIDRGGEEDILSEGTLSVDEAVAFSRLTRTRIFTLIRTGRLASVLIGRARLIPKSALKALLREHMEGM